MRTRILVTVLAVLGALAFLLWKPSELTRSPVGPAAEEAGGIAEQAELVLPRRSADPMAREAVESEQVALDVASERHPLELRFWPQGAVDSKDAIEDGACVLFLKLVDAKTGAAQKGLMNLWRLNAPGNGNWSAGDQLQETAKVLHEGREFVNLPPGSYRAVSLGSAFGSGYADAFQVGGALTEHTLLVQAPIEIETFVEIYNASGVRLEEIEVKDAGRSWQARKSSPPPWRVERVALHGNPIQQGGGGGGGGFGSSSHRSWRKLHASPQGFALGSFLQDSRERANQYRFDVRAPDGGVLELEIDRLPEPGGRLVAVFMSTQDVLWHVVFPDGRNGESFESSNTVRAHPVLVDAAHPDATWRDASVEVTVFHEKRRPWKRVWRPSEGPMTDRWIRSDEH